MHQITIAGVGLEKGDLTLAACDALRSAPRIILRTARCGCADWLSAQGIAFSALDALYEESDDFDALNERITDAIKQAAAAEDVLYAVPDLRDRAAMALLGEGSVRWIPGVALDAALPSQRPVQAFAAADVEGLDLNAAQAALVREIDTRQAASDVKLALMDRYPAEHPIQVRLGTGTSSIPLCDLDRLQDKDYAHSLCALVPAVDDLMGFERYGFNQLNRVMRKLRASDGCPWDIEQTHESIAGNCVEEAYEVVDAIRAGDMDALYDELGDLLLQVAFHAEIARQHGEFGIDDVTTAVCSKLISRHEHIFGTAEAGTPEEVLQIWEAAKKKERKFDTVADAMRGITTSLPQLMRAGKVQSKAAKVGFDWDKAEPALEKVYEEADEVKAALKTGEGLEEELGDLLFACVNVARLAKVDPELALHAAVDKFIRRFSAIEQAITADGKRMQDMTLTEMDAYWDRVKANPC